MSPTAPTDLQLSGFTKYLIAEGLLTENEANLHNQEAQKKKIPILSYLVANKFIDSKVVAAKASVEYGVPFFDLNAIDLRTLPIHLINEKLIRKHKALPLFIRGKTLFIALSDPTNLIAVTGWAHRLIHNGKHPYKGTYWPDTIEIFINN